MQTDCDRKRAKAFAYGLPMMMPQTRVQTYTHRRPIATQFDQRPIGADSFVRSFADVAQVKGITGYRVLMHNKYILRDVDSADAAVFTGSSNYTNDSRGASG